LEEADAIIITKQDQINRQEQENLLAGAQAQWSHARVFCISSKTAQGLQEWLDYIMTEERSGQRIVSVDYDRYAEGEAVLGWLNATVHLQSSIVDWQQFAKEFMLALTEKLKSRNAAIGHVKFLLEDAGDAVVANLTDIQQKATFRGEIQPSSTAILTLNARVEMEPDELDNLARQVLLTTAGDKISVREKVWRCLKPGRPEPTFRFDKIVEIL